MAAPGGLTGLASCFLMRALWLRGQSPVGPNRAGVQLALADLFPESGTNEQMGIIAARKATSHELPQKWPACFLTASQHNVRKVTSGHKKAAPLSAGQLPFESGVTSKQSQPAKYRAKTKPTRTSHKTQASGGLLDRLSPEVCLLTQRWGLDFPPKVAIYLWHPVKPHFGKFKPRNLAPGCGFKRILEP